MEEECIPVGYVPPASVAVSGRRRPRVCVCMSRGVSAQGGGGVCPEGVCPGEFTGGVCQGVCVCVQGRVHPPTQRQTPPPLPVACWHTHTPLWTEWQTGVKTLPCPKLRLRAVKIIAPYNKQHFPYRYWYKNTSSWSVYTAFFKENWRAVVL